MVNGQIKIDDILELTLNIYKYIHRSLF